MRKKRTGFIQSLENAICLSCSFVLSGAQWCLFKDIHIFDELQQLTYCVFMFTFYFDRRTNAQLDRFERKKLKAALCCNHFNETVHARAKKYTIIKSCLPVFTDLRRSLKRNSQKIAVIKEWRECVTLRYTNLYKVSQASNQLMSSFARNSSAFTSY